MRIRTRRKSRSKCSVERFAAGLLILIAWAWIMTTLGMFFYHGYYSRQTKHSRDVNRVSPAKPPFPVKVSPSSGNDSENVKPYESPLLIFTCNRDTYLSQTLTDIQKNIPKDCSIGCPIVISQDGSNPKVSQVISQFAESFQSMGTPLVHLEHKSSLRRGVNAYQALATHYGWALDQVFSGRATAAGHEMALPARVIILEEDLHTATDFFQYFKATAPLLDADDTLLAVSAFNDNGFKANVKDPNRLLRSDFFPGLGWMMTGKLWRTELQPKWPSGYWDDWLREPAQRKDRHIIRPEISRTFHFGIEGGASSNQFGDRLSTVLLNPTAVYWPQYDLSDSLEMHNYNKDYFSLVESAQQAPSLEEALELVRENDVRLTYSSFHMFQRFAQQLGLMTDEKAGVPRTAYYGVVETRPHGDKLLFLTPDLSEVRTKMNSM